MSELVRTLSEGAGRDAVLQRGGPPLARGRGPRALIAGGMLAPRYDLIEQSGLYLQWTAGGWLWKLDAIDRAGQLERWKLILKLRFFAGALPSGPAFALRRDDYLETRLGLYF